MKRAKPELCSYRGHVRRRGTLVVPVVPLSPVTFFRLASELSRTGRVCVPLLAPTDVPALLGSPLAVRDGLACAVNKQFRRLCRRFMCIRGVSTSAAAAYGVEVCIGNTLRGVRGDIVLGGCLMLSSGVVDVAVAGVAASAPDSWPLSIRLTQEHGPGIERL